MSESGEIFLHNQFLLEGLWGGGVGGVYRGCAKVFLGKNTLLMLQVKAFFFFRSRKSINISTKHLCFWRY